MALLIPTKITLIPDSFVTQRSLLGFQNSSLYYDKTSYRWLDIQGVSNLSAVLEYQPTDLADCY